LDGLRSDDRGFEQLYQKERATVSRLTGEIECLKSATEEQSNQKETMARDYEDYIRMLEEEIRVLRASLQKALSLENHQRLESLSVSTNPKSPSKRTLQAEAHLEELRGKTQALENQNKSMEFMLGRLRDELRQSDAEKSELITRINGLQGTTAVFEALRTENESLKVTNRLLTQRADQGKLQLTLLEQKEGEIRGLKSHIGQLTSENTHLKSLPPKVTERLVSNYQPCEECRRKSSIIDYLSKKVGDLQQSPYMRSASPVDHSLMSRSESRQMKSENVLTINCNCSQKCGNCGATPQTNITIVDGDFQKDQSGFLHPRPAMTMTPKNLSVINTTDQPVFLREQISMSPRPQTHVTFAPPTVYQTVNHTATISPRPSLQRQPSFERSQFQSNIGVPKRITSSVTRSQMSNKENSYTSPSTPRVVRKTCERLVGDGWVQRVTFANIPGEKREIRPEEVSTLPIQQFNEYSF
jgi:myosin heavy subunit